MIITQSRLFSTLCDNFCLWNREILIRQDFYCYFAEETISIDLVSTQKPEEPHHHRITTQKNQKVNYP